MLTRFCVAATAIAFVGLAVAEPTQDSAKIEVPSFMELDKDGNGGISRSEAEADPALRKIFTAMDRDDNGELLPGEFRKAAYMLTS